MTMFIAETLSFNTEGMCNFQEQIYNGITLTTAYKIH
jgi:hypothetical protein